MQLKFFFKKTKNKNRKNKNSKKFQNINYKTYKF